MTKSRTKLTYEQVLEVVRSYGGVPTAAGLGRIFRVSIKTVQKIISENSKLREAIEQRGREYLNGLNDRELVEEISHEMWVARLPEYANILYRGLDKTILRAIDRCDGVPNTKGLGKAIRISRGTIKKRIDQNPKLREAMEQRGRTYLENLGERELLRKVSNRVWVATLSEYAQQIVWQRLDEIIIRATDRYNGVTNADILRKIIGIDNQTIRRRIKKNPKLEEAMETKGKQYLENLSESELVRKIAQHGWLSSLPEYAKVIVYRRLDEIIIRAIDRCDGVPNTEGLGKSIRISRGTIKKRIDQNPKLREAMEQRGRTYLENLGERELLRKGFTLGWVSTISECFQIILYRRLDEIILKAIDRYDGVPTASGLERISGILRETILNRIKKNPKLEEAMETKGKQYLESLSERELVRKIVDKGYVSSLPEYAKQIVWQRLNKLILKAIDEYNGITSNRALGRIFGISGHAIQRRIDENPDLWMAFYKKRGLTPDQAVELALERDEKSNASTEVLNRRLRNLYAFREMAGIIRCFPDLLKGIILEITLYPSPLEKAAGELGESLDIKHQPMQPFRRGEDVKLKKANVVILQSIHRLATEAMTELFAKVYENLGYEHVVIATYSPRYAYVEGFEEALHRNGFQIKETGIMQIEPPSNETLAAYGVAQEDTDKVKRKIEGESHVLIFEKVKRKGKEQIPALEKLAAGEGNGRIPGEAEAVDMPPRIVKEINVKFLETPVVLPSASYLVEVVDGKRKVAVLGYDMDPRRRRSIESGVYPEAPLLDYRSIARRIATDIRERARLGVQPNKINRVSLAQLRSG